MASLDVGNTSDSQRDLRAPGMALPGHAGELEARIALASGLRPEQATSGPRANGPGDR
jgi:hypothetical protein